MMQIGMKLGFPYINYNTKLPSKLFNFADGSNVLSPSINFTRTSNATVTRSDGTIGYAPHNLLTFSEQFDNAAWSKTNLTVTANSIAAPDNTTTADKIEVTTTAATLGSRAIASIQATSLTYSIYVKKGNVATQANSFAIYNSTTATEVGRCTINYDTGVVTNVIGTAAYSVDAGNGWWRVVLPVTSGINIGNNIILYYGFLGTSITAGTFFYACGAQLEIGSTATAYNSTTVKNLLGHSELFENAAWTKSNSFVQTNLLTFSEDFSNAAWTAARVTFSANSAIAPNGYQTADKLIETATTGLHNVQQILTVTSGATYTLSIYAKAAERTILEVIDPYTLTGATFDLVNGTTGNPQTGGVTLATNRGIEPAANGFYRCYFRVTTAGTSLAMRAGLSDGSATSYAGNGTSGLIYWGAQIVGGSVAGDYRRTDAAALPVYYPNHNGVVCAEKLVENTASGFHVLTQSTGVLNGGKYTISLYVKAGERTWVDIAPAGLSNGDCWFNLATGTKVSTGSAVISADIFPAGNGWYRCTITYVSNALSSGITIVPSQTNSVISYQGDGTSGIYIFGAKLSDSASLDPYVLNAAAAPTAAAYYGARFNYNPVTLQPEGLLIEEQRANLLTYSNFSGAVAGTPGTSPTTWTFIVSNGITNAITTDAVGGNILAYTASVNRHFISQAVSVSANTTYTASVYINSNTGVLFNNLFSITGLPVAATVTYYANGVLINAATYVPLSGDRLLAIIVILAVAGTATVRLGLGVALNDTGTVSFSKPQLEAGAFATSYIPTAASQVTRTADVATIQGSNFYSWYNQNEGSVFGSASPKSAAGGANDIVNISDSSFTNQIRIYQPTSTNFGGAITTNSASQASISAGNNVIANEAYKVIMGYKLNDVGVSVNSSVTGTDNNAITPIVNILRFGSGATGAINYNGTIKSISYYPLRLSDSVLKGLTA